MGPPVYTRTSPPSCILLENRLYIPILFYGFLQCRKQENKLQFKLLSFFNERKSSVPPPPSFSKKQLQENKEGISREGVGNKSVKFDNKKVFFESSIYFAVIIITLLVLFVKDEQLFTADSKTFNKYDSVLLICALLLETKKAIT